MTEFSNNRGAGYLIGNILLVLGIILLSLPILGFAYLMILIF